MKQWSILLLTALLSTGCVGKTPYGDCVGLADDKDSQLVYRLSVWNTVIVIIFFETVFVPVIVAARELECPEGIRKEAAR